mgnify:CR=1 FL=1
MQLKPFHRADGKTAEAEQGKLYAAPAHRAAQKIAAGNEILADGRRWQVKLKVRDFTADMGDEAVGVGPRPDLVPGPSYCARISGLLPNQWLSGALRLLTSALPPFRARQPMTS